MTIMPKIPQKGYGFTEVVVEKLNQNTNKIKINFEEYTRKAYIIQRQKEPKRIKGKQEKVTLPTIKECEMTGKIPEELDFNTLYKIKNVCNELYKFTSNLN